MKIVLVILASLSIVLCFVTYKQYQTISSQNELLELSDQVISKSEEAIKLCDEIFVLYKITE